MCSPDTHPAPCTATPIGPIVSTSYASDQRRTTRSEEHTSELQSRLHLVCRLLLETKKPTTRPPCVRALPPPTTAWLYTTCTCSRSGSPTPLLHTPCPLSSHQHLTPNTTHTSTVS